MTVQYLFDENTAPSWSQQLLRRLPSLVVMRVGDPSAPPLHAPDPDILEWCEKEHYILVTNNRRSMAGHLQDHLAAGRHVPGIFMLPRKTPNRRLLEELILIASASLPDEYQDQIRFLPLT